MRSPKFEVYEAKDGWRWHLKSANGRILCQGESHTRERDAKRAVKTVKETVIAIGIVDMKERWHGATVVNIVSGENKLTPKQTSAITKRSQSMASRRND